MTTNAGKTGMKEVRMPLSSVRSENTVMEVLRPQVSDTRPARKVPRANLPSYHQCYRQQLSTIKYLYPTK